MYIYENHMGGLYVCASELDDEVLYCEACGGWDWLIGYAETREEAWEMLKPETDINGCGGYSYDYVQKFLDDNWGIVE